MTTVSTPIFASRGDDWLSRDSIGSFNVKTGVTKSRYSIIERTAGKIGGHVAAPTRLSDIDNTGGVFAYE